MKVSLQYSLQEVAGLFCKLVITIPVFSKMKEFQTE